MRRDFTWRDGERTIRFGRGALAEATDLLAAHGFGRYTLLTTERAATSSPTLVASALVVAHVPGGPVPDAAAAVRESVGGHPVVALGGGRVVDVAKAIASADGLACAVVPTTLAGSPMTPFHRLPKGVEGVRLVRPSLVIWDPDLAESLPRAQLTATAMNALAHGFESLYGPLANPVAELAALRAAELFGQALLDERADRELVALAALLAGYAVGTSGFAVHHAVCQTIVRLAGTPHAETNAVMLPHTVDLMAHRAPGPVGRFAAALGDPCGDPVSAARHVARLTAQTGVDGLRQLGFDDESIPAVVEAIERHPSLANTPGGSPSGDELVGLLRAAL
jgi:alcohol dehydrogenase class IV